MSSPSRQAFKDLLERYKTIWLTSWRERDKYIEQERLPYEAQFLPAALEIQQTPPSPLPRGIMWTLIAFFIIALIWACFGKIDIVAVAKGKVVPNDRVKTIQPVETSVVKNIFITDGQSVKKGDLLIELDATASTADQTRVTDELTSAKWEAARCEALLAALTSQKEPKLVAPSDMSLDRFSSEARLLQSQYYEYRTKLGTLDAEISKRRAELESTKQLVEKLEQTLPIVRKRAQDYKNLKEQKFVSEHAYLEKEQARIEQERDLAFQKGRLQEIKEAINAGQQQRGASSAEFKRTLLDKLNEAQRKVTGLSQESVKIDQRNKLTQLLAPVDGVAQQLAVHTVGGVVTPAQPLMIIVPKDTLLEVEAWIENKDIGFVHANQEAEIKIETFAFTRYGTITGKVLGVSNDAVSDEKKGLVYQARVLMHKSTVEVDGKMVNLSPGMAVTVEIKTGKRRVIEYFLSPLLQHGQESLKER